jgi:hypothetical protein
VLSRYELLHTLHREGINRFDAHRPDEPRADLRFPVFLRSAREHDGNLTPLLRDRGELDRALEAAGRPLDELLVVEFCDTSDEEGLFRKYAAFLVDGRIIPRHLLFARQWSVKAPTLVDPACVQEEWAYLRSNPHEEELKRIFRLARIDYGRIDYAMLDGRPQVWEINTNPVVMSKRRREYKPARRKAQVWFARRMREAFRALATSAGSTAARDLLSRLGRP